MNEEKVITITTDLCSDDDLKQKNCYNEINKKKSSLSISSNKWLNNKRSNKSKFFFNCCSITWLPLFLCFYAIIKEIKLSEPFLFKYQNDYLNFTKDEIIHSVNYYTPFAQMIFSIPIFLITDLLLYKPIMLMEMIGQIFFRGTLVFGKTLLSQSVGQIFYAIASASEVAYFSYIYAKLEKDQYKKLTSWTKAGTMGGRTFGYLLSQFLVYVVYIDLKQLNTIAFVIPCVIFFFCIFLPHVYWKTMVERILEAKRLETIVSNNSDKDDYPKSYKLYCLYRLKTLFSSLKVYKNSSIRKWSIWWALTNFLSLQVALFSQALWAETPESDYMTNSLAEATYSATATISILIMNNISFNWNKWGELALIVISTVDGLVLLLKATTLDRNKMYVCYVVYRSLFQVMITIAQWNIAKKMVSENYGFVFGVNSFVSLVMQCILNFFVLNREKKSDIRNNFKIYAGLHFLYVVAVLSVIVISSIVSFCQKRKVKPIVK